MVAMLLFEWLVTLVGFVMVPLMLLCDNRPAWLFRPWYNPEDGMHGPIWWLNYVEKRGHALSKRFPSFWWSAIRNPANGLRSYPILSVIPREGEVDFLPRPLTGPSNDPNPGVLRALGAKYAWHYCWQDYYAGFWLCIIWNNNKHAKFRIGWKLLPHYRYDPVDVQLGFAGSILPWRNG